MVKRIDENISQFISLILLAVFTIVLAVCCSSQAAREPVEYPATWPLKELSVPADSWKAPLSVAYTASKECVKENVVNNRGMPGESRSWAIGFGTELEIHEVYAHFDEILGPLGYLIHRDNAYVRGYVSKDGWTMIQISLSRIPFQGQKPKRPYSFSLNISVEQNEPARFALERAIPIPES